MKIFLINMPFFEQEYTKFSEKWEYIEDEYIGVGIVRKIFENNGCQVIVNQENSIGKMIEVTQRENPDMVVISVMQTSARLTYNFINQLRDSGWKGKIFIGGWFAKMAWREIFLNNWKVDYVCYCDAEMVLEKWLKNPEENIVGIATLKNYDFHDKLKLIDIRKRNKWPISYVEPSRIKGRNTYCIETSRGCPHSFCTFCSQSCGNITLNKWQSLPLELVKKQIVDLYNLYGVTRFSTTDDDLLGPIENSKQRAKELCNILKSLPFPVNFSGSISVKSASDGEILDLLQEAGLEQLCVGFESADEGQLKRYGKQQSLDDNYKAAYEITNRKIPLLPGLITFDPFATVETISKNLNFLFNELKHYDLGKLTKKLHILTGTPMVQLIAREGLLRGDYLYYDYEFKNEEVTRLYKNFNEYTNMVKELQQKANKSKLQYNPKIGMHHKIVAEAILKNTNWKEIAQREIKKMKYEIGEWIE